MPHDCQLQMHLHREQLDRAEQKSVWQEAFNGQEMGSMEELRNTAPIPKPVLQVRFASLQHCPAAIILTGSIMLCTWLACMCKTHMHLAIPQTPARCPSQTYG